MTNPLTDPRPFAEVLRDWQGRHCITANRIGVILRARPDQVPKWLAGTIPTHEYGLRALMLLHDEGRA